jgi:hypothetical protein
MIEPETVSELARRASKGVQTASAADLWDVLENGNIDSRVGMPGSMPGLGVLVGPGPFETDLSSRDWADSATSITEVFFDLGEWTWQGDPPSDSS